MKILNIILITLLSTLIVSLGVVVAQDIQNPEDKSLILTPAEISINLEMPEEETSEEPNPTIELPREETKPEVTLDLSNKDQNDLVIDSIDSITKQKPSITDSGGRSREREKNVEPVNNARAPRTTTNQKFGTFTGTVELYVDGKPVEKYTFLDGVEVEITILDLEEELEEQQGILGDLDRDGDVDRFDMTMLVFLWKNCPGQNDCWIADLDSNGNIDASDLMILLDNWTEEYEFNSDLDQITLEDVSAGNSGNIIGVEDLLALLGAWGPCEGECPYDYNEDGIINESDLNILLAFWGQEYNLPRNPDINLDGTVGVPDLLILLGSWGSCDDPKNCPADLDYSNVVGQVDIDILFAYWGTESNSLEEIDPSISIIIPGDTEPTVILSSPLDGTEFEGPSVVVDFVFTVADDGGISECFITVSSEGGLTFTETISFPDQKFISGGTTYTKTISIELNSGIYTALVLCIDNSGNTGTSNPTLFTITNGPINSDQVEELINEEIGCQTDWICSEWSECNAEAGTQTRTCTKEINNCYANPNDKPEETQECVIIEEIAAPIEELEQLQGLLSRITGAVIGLGNNPGFLGLIILIFVIAGGYTVVAIARKKKK